MTPLSIPQSPAQITQAWLASVLLESKAIPSTNALSGFELKELGEAQGITGSLSCLSLHYRDSATQGPQSLFIKFPASASNVRSLFFDTLLHYEREVVFYDRIAPQLSLRVPKCYFSYVDVKAQKFALLIENLQPMHCGDIKKGCTRDEAFLATETIAKFHAEWWDKPELKTMDWLPVWGPHAIDSFCQGIRENWDRFLNRLPNHSSKALNKLAPYFCDTLETVMAYDTSGPQTLRHFDYHLENIFFGSPDSAEPIALIDWQLPSLGRGPCDLALFLSFDFEPAQRKELETELIDFYYKTLIGNGVSNYSYDQCLYDYRISLLTSLQRNILVGGDEDGFESDQKKVTHIISPRIISALTDNRVIEILEKL